MEKLLLEEVGGRDIDLFVVSDAEAILGIGDQGVGVSLFIRWISRTYLITNVGYWGMFIQIYAPKTVQLVAINTHEQISTAKSVIYS